MKLCYTKFKSVCFFDVFGEEDGWDTQDVHRLLGFESESHKEPVPNSPDWRADGWIEWSKILLQNRSPVRIPPNQNEGGRHTEDNLSLSFWSFWVFGNAIWLD